MAKSKDELSIENNLRRLEEIASQLDRGELAIDEQIKIFEEGMKLANVSKDYLSKAELRVRELSNTIDSDEEGA